jgi:hypothetical protein
MHAIREPTVAARLELDVLVQGAGSSIQSTLSASAVTVERFESITVTRLGSRNGIPRNASQSAGASSIRFRVVASKGLLIVWSEVSRIMRSVTDTIPDTP